MEKKQEIYLIKKIIFWILVLAFCLLIVISLIYGFIYTEEEPEFDFSGCMEKYLFVYEDFCSNESFYITHSEKEAIKGKLSILTVDDYPYFVYWKRCTKNYEIGCGEYYGKI